MNNRVDLGSTGRVFPRLARRANEQVATRPTRNRSGSPVSTILRYSFPFPKSTWTVDPRISPTGWANPCQPLSSLCSPVLICGITPDDRFGQARTGRERPGIVPSFVSAYALANMASLPGSPGSPAAIAKFQGCRKLSIYQKYEFGVTVQRVCMRVRTEQTWGMVYPRVLVDIP
jgi:hypothetical protein